MIALTLFFAAQFGFAYIVGHSAISEPLRYLLSPPMRVVNAEEPPEPVPTPSNIARHWLLKLIECPSCLGFWTGGIFGRTLIDGTGYVPTLFAGSSHPLFLFVFVGCATAGMNFILGRMTRLM